MEARELSPYVGNRYDVCVQKVCFSAVLVRNSISILAILSQIGCGFCALDLGILLEEATF